MRQVILTILLVFGAGGALQAEHRIEGEVHDFRASFTIPKLEFRCYEGFEFAIVQTAIQLKSFQVMGENGLPLLCGPRESDNDAAAGADLIAAKARAEMLAQQARDAALKEKLEFAKILADAFAKATGSE